MSRSHRRTWTGRKPCRRRLRWRRARSAPREVLETGELLKSVVDGSPEAESEEDRSGPEFDAVFMGIPILNGVPPQLALDFGNGDPDLDRGVADRGAVGSRRRSGFGLSSGAVIGSD